MSHILYDGHLFTPDEYGLEKDFEREVVAYAKEVFGPEALYIDVKRRIGKDNIVTIPDAYLIDFAFPTDPRLYIVENELVKHDPFRHIGQQLLKFAISYKTSGRKIKRFLSEAILKDKATSSFVSERTERAGYRNLDVLLDDLIFEKPVAAVVVIDEVTEDLENVLAQLTMKTDVIELRAFSTDEGKRLHLFTPFQPEVREATGDKKRPSVEELDTVVVPARDEGFQEVFVGEDRWYSIRMSASMVDRVKYVAAYRTAPVSAITHYAEVADVQKWKDTNKYVLNFKGPAKEMETGPVPLPEGKPALAPQAPRYTSFRRLVKAKTLADLF